MKRSKSQSSPKPSQLTPNKRATSATSSSPGSASIENFFQRAPQGQFPAVAPAPAAPAIPVTSPKSPDYEVACPQCNFQVKFSLINSHMDFNCIFRAGSTLAATSPKKKTPLELEIPRDLLKQLVKPKPIATVQEVLEIFDDFSAQALEEREEPPLCRAVSSQSTFSGLNPPGSPSKSPSSGSPTRNLAMSPTRSPMKRRVTEQARELDSTPPPTSREGSPPSDVVFWGSSSSLPTSPQRNCTVDLTGDDPLETPGPSFSQKRKLADLEPASGMEEGSGLPSLEPSPKRKQEEKDCAEKEGEEAGGEVDDDEETKAEAEDPQRMRYYERSFNEIASTFRQDNAHLLSEDERKYLDKFESLRSQDAKRMYIRLFQRKPVWIRKSTVMHYKDIGDILAAIDLLEKEGFLVSDEKLEDFEVALRCLGSEPLKLLVKDLKETMAGGTREVLIQFALSYLRGQRTLFERTPRSRMLDLIRKHAGRLISLSVPFKDLCRRMGVAYHMKASYEDRPLAALIMEGFSGVNYPMFKVIKTREVFPRRIDLINYDKALKVEQFVSALLENLPGTLAGSQLFFNEVGVLSLTSSFFSFFFFFHRKGQERGRGHIFRNPYANG